jgi:hypothetical protein
MSLWIQNTQSERAWNETYSIQIEINLIVHNFQISTAAQNHFLFGDGVADDNGHCPKKKQSWTKNKPNFKP